jgi:hypothetical protein
VKILRLLIFILILGGAFWLGYTHFFPNDEKRILKMFDRLAQSASIPEKKSAVSTIMSLDQVQSCFEPDVEIRVESPIESLSTGISGRDELMQGIQAAWARYNSIKVEILDVTVTVDPSKETATSMLTAKVSRPGEKEFFFQEFRAKLKKKDGNWRIARMEPVKVFH